MSRRKNPNTIYYTDMKKIKVDMDKQRTESFIYMKHQYKVDYGIYSNLLCYNNVAWAWHNKKLRQPIVSEYLTSQNVNVLKNIKTKNIPGTEDLKEVTPSGRRLQ